MKKEREYKFYNVANQQFKFAAIDRHGIFENKVRTVCSWLGIACKQPLLQEIRDEYYDDKHFSLKEAGYSLRLRQENSIFRYTLKRRAVESKSSNPVKRDEHEEPITRAGFKKIVNSTTGVMDLIKTNFGQVVKCAACDLILTVKNDRTTLPIVTKRERYSLTYDIFYFLYGRRFSEVLLEVEIESKRPNPPKDAQIDRLREAFEVLFNYQPNSESKLERGVDWIDDPDGGVITIYTLMMDIVGYSKETAGSQKQMVQTLSKVTRDVILKNRYN